MMLMLPNQQKHLLRPGQMFVNWMLSSMAEGQPTGATLVPILVEFCTNLLAAGVMEQISDVMAPVQAHFRVIYSIPLNYYPKTANLNSAQPDVPMGAQRHTARHAVHAATPQHQHHLAAYRQHADQPECHRQQHHGQHTVGQQQQHADAHASVQTEHVQGHSAGPAQS